MSKGRFFVKPALAVVAICSGMFFPGCEIGLGPAVDTEAPRLSIDSPKVNEAKANTFELNGKCWDDTKVSHVDIVSISSNDEKSVVYSNLGSVTVNGEEWNIPLRYEGDGVYDINGKKIELKDGTWIVEMVAYDENRDGIPVARSFDIDNTPPVFLLSTPSAVEACESGSPYGRSVKISGTIADSHSIEKMSVTAFRDDGSKINLAATDFYGFDKSNTDVVIAKYSASSPEAYDALTEDEKLLQKNYMALFDEEGDWFTKPIKEVGKKKIYLYVELTDKAGNTSKYSYISTELASMVRDLAQITADKDLDGVGYMRILNGTYSGPFGESVVAGIRNALLGGGDTSTYRYLSYDSGADHSRLLITVNPDNSPTFEVTDCAIESKGLNGTWKGINKGDSLTIHVKAGLDHTAFVTKDLAVKIYKAEDGTSNFVPSDENLRFTCSIDENGDALKHDSDDAFALPPTDDAYYTFTVPKNSSVELEVGEKYYVVVEGMDTQKKDVVPLSDMNYGFTISPNGKAPYTESDDKKYFAAKAADGTLLNQVLPLTIIDSNVNLKTVDKPVVYYSFQYYEGHYDTVDKIMNGSPAPVAAGPKQQNTLLADALTVSDTNKWTANIPLGTCPEGADNYTVLVSVKGSNGSVIESHETYYLLYVDCTSPELTVDNENVLSVLKKINPSTAGVTYETKEGKKEYSYEFRGKVSDVDGSGVSNIMISLDGGENWISVDDTPHITSPAAGWNYKWENVESGTKSVQIKAMDTVGNVSSIKDYPGIVIDFTPPRIYMDYVKYTDSGESKTDLKPESLNDYYTSEVNIKFKGEDEGGSGINALKIDVSKKEIVKEDGKDVEKWITPAQSSSTWGLVGNERKITADGIWKIVAKAEDKSGQYSPELVLTTTIDKTAPSLGPLSVMEKSPSEMGYYTNGTLQVKIPYTETGSGLASASYRIGCSDNSSVLNEGIAVTGQGENEELIITTSGFTSEDGGINTLYVTVKDKAGNQCEAVPLTVKIDKGAPKLGVKWYDMSLDGTAAGTSLSTYPETIYYTNTSEHLLYGTVSDEGGIEKLDFIVGGTSVNPTELLFSKDSVELGDSSSFVGAEWKTWDEVKDSSYNISAWKARFKNLDANGKLTVKATDKVGLETSVSEFVNLKSDNDGPAISVQNLSDGDTVVDSKIIDDKFTLIGKWNDNGGSGTKLLKWSTDGVNYTDGGVSASGGQSESPWTIVIPKESMPEGTGKTIYLRAWDELENVSEFSIGSLVYDYTAPTLTIDSPANPREYYNASDNPLEIVFKSTDNIAVDKVELVKVERNGSDVSVESPVGYTFTPNAGKTALETAKITIPCDGNSDGKWSFKLRAKDCSGLYSEIVSLSTTVDSGRPSIDLTNATVEGKPKDGWYGSNVVKVEAKALDTGAGLSKILYKVVRTNESIPENLDSTAGSVSVSGTDTQFNVMASVSEESTLSPEVHNLLLMQAFDLAGNKSGVAHVVLKIDHASPSASAKFYRHDKIDSAAVKIEGTVMTNGEQGLIIYGSINDNLSGVDKVVPLGADGKEILGAELYYSTEELPAGASGFDSTFEDSLKQKNELGDGEIKSFKIKIPKSRLESGNISATLWDLAGNSAKIRMLDIEKDSENPEVNLRFPATIEVGQTGTATKVNGKITIDGTASDNSTLASVKLEKFVDGGWTEIKTLTGIGAYNWSSGELEMTKVDGDSIIMFSGSEFNGSSEEVLIRATAEDAAGNQASKTFKYTADPESDRPEIRINNIVLKNENSVMSETVTAWLQSKTIYGSISDDDGSVQKFEYKDSDPNIDSGWSTINVSGGTWTLDINTDGARTVYFRVTDAAGSKFTSGAVSTSPKLTDGTNSPEISYLNLTVDTKNPNVGDLYYQIKKRGEGENWSEPRKDIAKGLFGGDYKYLRFYLHAEDENGISDVKFKVDGMGPQEGYEFDDSESNLETGDYYSKTIDLVDYDSDTYTINAVVTDNAKKETEKSARFNVDNDSPKIDIHSPDIVVSASSMSGEIDELSTLYFALTKSDEVPSVTAEKLSASDIYTTTSGGKWMPINGPWATFNVVFDGNLTTPTVTHALILKDYFGGLGMNVTEDDEYAYMNFSVMAVDPCGNTNVKTELIQIDPWGDKPSVAISNPKSGNTLGGEINISGTAMDLIGTPAAVKAVGLMMDVNGDNYWTRADMAFINQKHSDYTWCTFDSHEKRYQTVDIDTILADPSLDEASVAKKYALVADLDGNGWSFTMNRSREFDPGVDEKARNITVWAFAIDEDFNTSAIDVTVDSHKMKNVSFKIDSDAPQIANKRLVRKNNSNVVMNYESQMAVKGEWYFEADIFDNNNVSTITVDGVTVVENCMPTNRSPESTTVTVEELVADYIEADPNIPGTASGFKIRMSVGTDTPGTVFEERHEITITENKSINATTIPDNVLINIDNKAPLLVKSGTGYNIREYESVNKAKIADYNGFHTFGAVAREDTQKINGVEINQTGVARVAFYITRDIGTGSDNGTSVYSRLYDPMIRRGQAGNYIPDYAENTRQEDGLYWISRTVSNNVSKSDSVIIDSMGPNIHRGGLVKINGVIHRIADVSNSTRTVKLGSDGNPDTVTVAGGTEIYFALANIVDNPIQEGDGSGSVLEDGYWASPVFDDGDRMVETFVTTGTSCSWSANIVTKNIGDGRATLHYVVFDKAGNYDSAEVPIFIGNNLPRISGLTFATDDNDDGKFTGDEIHSYKGVYGVDGVNSAMFPKNSTTENPFSIATVRNRIQIVPEVVGGNGALSYSMDVYRRNNSDTAWNTSKTGSVAVTALGKNGSDTAQDISIDMSVAQIKSAGIEDGDNEKITVTIEDSTPGEKMETDLSLILNIALDDSTAPVIRIRPFYWNSANDNSLFENSTANGHIELPNDLPDTFTSGASDKEMDRQPKVSGKIRIEGVSWDNAMIKKINLKIDGGAAQTIATYDKEWKYPETLPAGISDVRITRASYRELLDSGILSGFVIPENENENSLVNEISQMYGHVVKWSAAVDTETVFGSVTCIDKNISVEAVDRGSPDNSGEYSAENLSDVSSDQSGGADGSGDMTNCYTMDVVPYVTGVKTALNGKLKSSINSAYSRTALGHYVVRNSETVYISGFNLGSSSVKPKYGSTELAISNGTVSLPVDMLSSSGEILLTVGGVKILNNLNDNNACGSYRTGTRNISEASSYADKNKYAYNRMPNRTSNNLLTDDLVIDIWQFDSDAALPMSGELREPSMQINPVTGQVGLAFVSGPANFAMAGKNGTSYTDWQQNYATFNNISFAYDALGNAHATSTGLDTNPSNKHAGRFSYFYNKWGRSGTDQAANYSGANAIRLESIAVPYIEPEVTSEDKETYNSYFENLSNGDLPLEIRKNYKILANEELIKTEAGSMTETRFYSPSLATTVHGAGASAKTTAYLAYYDSVQKQIRFRFDSEVASDKKTSKDDFMDEKGYKHGKTGDEETAGNMYYEANTKYFSLIAGLDTQQGATRSKEYTGDVAVNKTDAEGNALYTRSTYRRGEFNANGELVKNKNESNYDLTTFTVNDAFLKALKTEDLKSRFTEGQTVDVIRTDNKYIWIVQPDGLIYYTTDNNAAKGYMTHKISEYKASDKSLNGCKLDPAENYIVYERVSETDGNYYLEDGQPPYFWPYATAANVIKVDIPVHQINYYKAYDTGYTAYKYVAIDAKTGTDAAHDTVVAVWYDGTNCRYAYNDNPTSGKDNGGEVTIDGVTYGGGWKGNKVIFTEGGEHCTVKLDPEGGVHIAAYVDGSLRYAYLPSVDADYSEAADSVKVDSFTITGERITLDVGKDSSGNVIPYISYFNGTARLPSVARLVVPESGIMDYRAQGTGTIDGDDMFTGNWEISLVPSSKTLTTNYYDKMNICLWKQNGSIVRGDSAVFTISKTKTSANNVSGTTDGSIYGNGTANPILGYAIESNSGTCLETAQMR